MNKRQRLIISDDKKILGLNSTQFRNTFFPDNEYTKGFRIYPIEYAEYFVQCLNCSTQVLTISCMPQHSVSNFNQTNIENIKSA